MNVWQSIVAALKGEGIRHVFGLPGGDLFHDALYDVPEIEPVLVRDENAAPFMAMGVARVSGRPGVCYGSPGPGVTNLISGVLEAYAACLPVVVIGASSDRGNAGMGAFQETDQMSLMKPVTKWCDRITEPERTPWVMGRAFSIAANGKPGPVYIDIPKDIGMREASIPEYTPAVYPRRCSADPRDIEEAATLLMQSKRPLIVAGGGAVSSGAFSEVETLAELMGIPVMTTPCGRGILPEDHRLALGQVGLYFTELGERVYAEADLLMTLGSRNEDFQSGQQRFFPEGARYIQVDIDPQEIGRNWRPDVAMLGDVTLVLRDLAERLRESGADKMSQKRAEQIAEERRVFEARVRSECQTDAVPIKTKRVVRELNDVFGRDTILVNENGSQDLWSYYWPYYKVLSVNCCVAPGEQTCMGGGCSAAIGAKLAAPSKDVVCPVGDGAFQMFMKELPTAVQHHAPVTYVVLNNNGLGWVRRGQKLRGDRFIATEFEVQPDFVRIAEASGCHGERVEKPESIRPALERALKTTRNGIPAVVDVAVDGWDFAPGFERFYARLSQ